MPNIPHNIPSNPNLIRNAKPPVKQNTGTGESITPKAVFALPYQGGEAAMNLVDNISKFANAVSDEDAKNKAFQEGKDRETAANKAGTTTISSDELLPSWTISGKAFEEGQNVAFLTHQELKINDTLWELTHKKENFRNIENFLLDTAEFEKDFLTELPEKMQSAVYLAYQKQKQVFEQEIKDNMFTDQRNLALGNGKRIVSQKVNSAYSAIVNNADSGIIMDLVQEARTEIVDKFTKLGVTQNAINIQIDAFRLQLFEAFLIAEYEKADVKGKATIEKAVRTGTWIGSLDTKDLTKVFPKGMALTGDEREKMKLVLTKLKKNYKTAHEKVLSSATDEATKAMNSNKDASKLYKLYAHDTGAGSADDADNSMYVAFKSENDKFRIRKDLELGGATTQALELFDQEWAESIKIGTAAYHGYILGRGTTEANHMANEFAVAVEISENAKIGDGDGEFPTPEDKSAHITLIKAQEKAFNLAQETLSKHLNEPGGNQATALIEAGVINFDRKNYNGPGVIKLKEDVARMLNVQIDTINIIPMELVEHVHGRLKQTTSDREYLMIVEEILKEFGNKTTYQIFQKLTATSDNVKDDAVLALYGIYKPDKGDITFDNKLAEIGTAAVQDYDKNFENLVAYAELGDSASERVTNFSAEVAEEFVSGDFQYLGATLSSVQGQSYKALYEAMFAHFLFTTRGKKDRAKELTREFILKTHWEGEIAEGVTILASRNDIPGEGEIWEKYKETYAQVKKDPLAFGAVSARFETIQDLEGDFENFYVGFGNQSMTYYDESGRAVMLSHMGQDGASMYSEFKITPYSLRTGNIAIDQQLQNQADDIEYNHSESAKAFGKVVLEDFPEVMPIGEVDAYSVTAALTFNEKASKVTIAFRKTVDADPKDKETFEYLKKKDFAIRELTHNDQEQDTLTMIGHAVSTGQVEPWMLKWIGANIPYGKSVQYKENIDKVMEMLKDPNNYERFKNGLTDKGDSGSIQTPMQYLFSMIRELQPIEAPTDINLGGP